MKEHNYGFFKDDKIYRKGFLDFPDKIIGEVRTSEEATLKYFEDRFEIAKKKVETLEQEVEAAENKGSYLMKLIHLKRYLGEFDGLGDFLPLFQKLDELEIQLRELIAVNRSKNLEIKQALLIEAEQTGALEDLEQASTQMNEVKQKWIKTGSVAKEFEEDIEVRFNEILKRLSERKRDVSFKKREEEKEKVKKFEAIIAEADKLRFDKDKDAAIDRLKELHGEWKQVGTINRKKLKWLWTKFKYISDFIMRKGKPAPPYTRTADAGRRSFEPRKRFPQRESGGYRKSPDNPEESVRKKEQLIYLVGQLRGKYDDDTIQEVRKFQRIWSTTGKIAPEKYKELFDKFSSLCDEVTETALLEKKVSEMEDYHGKSESEKVNLKIRLLYETINQDQKHLDAYIVNVPKPGSAQTPEEKAAGIRVAAQKRRLRAKRKLLNELRKSLENTY